MNRNKHEGAEVSDSGVFLSREPLFRLEQDLILPAETRTQINECLAKLRFHRKIYIEWNFGSVDPMGVGTVLNFYGPPGTGKTLAAEAMAGTLGVPIISIGIAEIESKYMGETAKNIKRAFAEAAESGALLFFDEADTLLGKRLSSVTQGVDNEVNSMRSTMLIELERFEGVVVFATNFARNYDEAFRSRISYHVKFILPDLEARKALWSRMLVDAIPLNGERNDFIDWCAELSENLSGREIRTCMRLALPKAMMEQSGVEPALSLGHLKDSIHQVKLAQTEVASSRQGRSSDADLATAKRLLGVNNTNQ